MTHRIPLRIALVAAVTAGVISWLFCVFGTLHPASAVFVSLVVGGVVFTFTRRQFARRLQRIGDLLNELLEAGGRRSESTAQDGDELDRLIRRADQAHHAVDKRMAELSRAESYRREYVGDVSHELKTPIFAVQGFAETLLSGALTDPAVNRGFVEKILYNAERLTALVKDLSEISRLETGALKLDRAAFDVRTVFEEIRENLEHRAREEDINLRADVDRSVERVVGDRERIQQVLSNLVDNAIKYTNPGGWIRLRAEPSDSGQVRISVADNGIGIAEEDIHRVTERFYRADKSRSRGQSGTVQSAPGQGGTGLGLAIVKHILAAHGVRLEIESRVGEGSTFSFTLPTARGAVG